MMLTWMVLIAQVAVAPYLAPDEANFDEEDGLLLHSQVAPEGGTIDYERPVVLLPVEMTAGEIHSSQRRFVLRVGGETKDVGAHYFEAELLGTESIDGHTDCLKIRRHAIRMDYSGTQQGYDVTEWYARGVGLVRAEGQRFWRDAGGETIRTEAIP